MPSRTKTRPQPEPAEPLTALPQPPVVQVRATSPPPVTSSVMVLSPALWIYVVLVTVGSILALALFFIYYKHKARTSRTQADAAQHQDSLLKAEPPVIHVINNHAAAAAAAAGGPPGALLYPVAQTGSAWEDEFSAYRDPPEHAGTGAEGGLPSGGTAREHRVPLPATELGGTVLVTTKTM
ncbi:uncharacterized protein LOC117809718 isoform X2 [Notolabrus celidotus]|nr:uncharacterized protein LOC117809718 isoform X2 [Notolabrus celidotus]